MPASLTAFGKGLKKFLNSCDVFSLLHEGDWGAGGCWMLASALKEYLGPPAMLIAVSERRARDMEDVVLPVSHVAVFYIDLIIDYNGAQTEKEFIRNLKREGYEDPQIHKMTKKLEREATQYGIPCDINIIRELISKLVKKFGP